MAEEKTVSNEEMVVATPTKKKETAETHGGYFYVQRIVSLLAFFLIFIPSVNPARISILVNKNLSLFTSGISYKSLIKDVGRGFRAGWITEDVFHILNYGSLIATIGVIAMAVAACASLGNLKFKRVANITSAIGSVITLAGIGLVYYSYTLATQAKKLTKVQPTFSVGIYIYAAAAAIILIATIIAFIRVPKPAKDDIFEMATKYKLFLMFLPFALLAFVFSYLPLWGWRYAFFDYRAGDTLTMDKWVGFKWFTYLFQNEATKRDIVRVLTNTLAMSGLGIITSWVPLAFAIFLTEITNLKFRRFVQTFTTIPNFISWILVYTVAIAIFSTDGFINTFAQSMGWISSGTNYLMDDSHTWLKMLAWGLWKGTGWSAIIYIAGISGIDRQLYEAATVDGAGRFQRIWHVTIPGLLPTYMVMLLMAVAGMLSNGLDQYLVFSNAKNLKDMEVLDLYVYNLGFSGGAIPLSTVVGMTKSIISVALLFMANGISKLVRGESIV